MAGDGHSFAVHAVRNVAGANTFVNEVLVYDACPCDGDTPIGNAFLPIGRTLASSSDARTLAFGSPAASDGISPNQGAIHVFGRGDNGAWSRQAKLHARSARAFDVVGSHLAIPGDGKTIVTKACGYAAFDAGLRRNHPADATLASPEGFPPAPFCSEELTNPYGGVADVSERSADAEWSHVAAFIPAPGRVVPFDFGMLALSADGGTLAMCTVVQFAGDDPWGVVID